MSSKSKLEYLNVLMNIKNNVYKDNKLQLKKDLLIVQKLLLIEANQNNQDLQRLEESFKKVLKIAWLSSHFVR